MKLRSLFPPTARNHVSFLSSPSLEHLSTTSQQVEIAEDSNNKVYVAVGKSVKGSVDLLRWTFRRFENQQVCLVYVHQPSTNIPTLLGRLPASHANEELLSAYRREERGKSRELLLNYLSICTRAKVKATIITDESGQVHKSIVELVKQHGIRKLVMGALPDDFLKVKKIPSKAKYAAKNAPPFCEIWFINKGKHIWMREALEYHSFWSSMLIADETAARRRPRVSCVQIEPDSLGVASLAIVSSYMDRVSQSVLRSSSSATSDGTYDKIRGSLEFESKIEKECLYNQMLEARTEAEISKNEAFGELMRRRKLESETAEAVNKVQAMKVAHASEIQLRRASEDALRSVRLEKKMLLEQTEEVSRELQTSKRKLAALDKLVTEAHSHQSEAVRELSLIQMSVTTLTHERKKIHRQKEKVMCQLELWRNQGQAESLIGEDSFVNTSTECSEFSFSDLCTATCNFAEGFKIGYGGCVYKGEISGRSVAIKRLNPLNMQRALKFQQEVQVLSKVKHPRLVTLIGACPEASSLVYEYMPYGSLHDHLFCKTSTHPLTWKIRTRIAADMARSLLWLQSSTPEKIVHGNLKPENIFFDSEFNCKIGDFGTFQLVREEILRCPSFRGITETDYVFPYKDPELSTGDLTTKSDIYSFGVIILQLITGRPPAGLVSEVSRAVLSGKLASLLDPSAGEWPTFVARRLAGFGLKCCEFRSQDRPELKATTVRELEQLHLAEDRSVPSFLLCPIFQEVMHDPQVAADGFTYEGEAISGWLKNGHETSPMTNLRLSHLHLTPNHALRLAIQDWLCIS